jgi:hypothetical protein
MALRRQGVRMTNNAFGGFPGLLSAGHATQRRCWADDGGVSSARGRTSPAEALVRLIESGVWPRTELEANRQNLSPLASRERISALAPEESELFLLPPPFGTVARYRAHGEEFWDLELAAPSGLEFSLTIPIADFGLGSDAPIVLDYREDRKNPRVLRLRYGATHADNRWVLMAPTFDAFVEAIGLGQRLD